MAEYGGWYVKLCQVMLSYVKLYMLLVLFVPGTCFGGVFTKPTHQTEFHHQTAIKAHGAEGVGEFGLLGF